MGMSFGFVIRRLRAQAHISPLPPRYRMARGGEDTLGNEESRSHYLGGKEAG